MSDPGGTAAAATKDRSTGLVLFGLLQLAIGLFALAMAGLSLVASALAPAGVPAQSGRQIAFGIAFYLVVAALFVTLGIGSLLARRWARALMLVVSWFWLVFGVLSLVAIVFLFPMMQETTGKALDQAAAQRPSAGPGPDPALVGAFALGCAVASIVLFGIALPALFVLFYRSPHVRSTCAARDPRPRWTDRLPLPVLSLVLLHGFGVLTILGSVLGYGAFAIFGRVVSGAGAWLLAAVLTAALALAVAWSWRLDVRGWWLAVALWAFGLASAVGTVLHPLDWNELYRAMGMDPSVYAQLDLGAWSRQFSWLSLAALVPWLAYLLWVRRFFARPAPAAPLAPGL
ncbi:MAG: hypothetical protein AMXMBFR36_15250 [Acidobacteriota bacterium]